MSPRRTSQGKICQRHEFMRIIRFSKGVIGVVKVASSLERLYGRIFLTEFGGTVNENSSKVRRNTNWNVGKIM